MSLSKVIETARADLGYTENPRGSNLTKYGNSYGLNGVPWCVIFLWYVFQQADEKMAFFGGAKTASCGTLYRWYKEQGLSVLNKDIQVGDILILNFSGTQDTQHCGLVVEKGKLAGTWYTIEGNTSPGLEGSQDNGGCVALKLRSVKSVVGVCRPQYKEETVITSDYESHWAKDHIEWGIRLGLIKGYDDGTVKPNNTLTRAELMAILHRYDEYRFGNSENKN